MSSSVYASRDALNRLFRRCVECEPGNPACGTCKDGETCTLIPQSCNACAQTQCVSLGSLPGQAPAPKASTPIGPIVGGVIGGVAVIILAGFCLWFCCIKPRRRKDTWVPPEKRDPATLSRSGDPRTNSIASTILTRASNVIQIAYIPGVTGRSPPQSPGAPPPMPSIPQAYQGNGASQPETHFFMPNDLRDSTWSDASADPRISLAPSLARASVATTIVPAMPAQQAYRAHANVVSVKQASSTTTPIPSIPEMPAMPPPTAAMSNSSIVARNVTARPIEISKTNSGNRVPTLGNLSKANSAKGSDAGRPTDTTSLVSHEKEAAVSSRVVELDSTPLGSPRMANASAMSFDNASISQVSAVVPADGPLSAPSSPRRQESDGITAMIEDAIKNATKSSGSTAPSVASPRPGMTRADTGPFSDAHEMPDTSTRGESKTESRQEPKA